MNPARCATPNPTIKIAPHVSSKSGCRNSFIHQRRVSARVAAGCSEEGNVAAVGAAAVLSDATVSAAAGSVFSESLIATSLAFPRSNSLIVTCGALHRMLRMKSATRRMDR
jgi:hypothetical protein